MRTKLYIYPKTHFDENPSVKLNAALGELEAEGDIVDVVVAYTTDTEIAFLVKFQPTNVEPPVVSPSPEPFPIPEPTPEPAKLQIGMNMHFPTYYDRDLVFANAFNLSGPWMHQKPNMMSPWEITETSLNFDTPMLPILNTCIKSNTNIAFTVISTDVPTSWVDTCT